VRVLQLFDEDGKFLTICRCCAHTSTWL